MKKLAYKQSLFKQCVGLLKVCALKESEGNGDSATKVLVSLFHFILSGTHASKELRLESIKELMNSKKLAEKKLAIKLLSATLKSSHFSSDDSFNFGGLQRDYGYYPSSEQEIIDWFTYFSDYTVETILLTDCDLIKSELKASFARKLNSFLYDHRLFGLVNSIVERLVGNIEWSDGWEAIGQFLRFGGGELPTENKEKLLQLKQKLKPVTIEEQVHMYLFSENHSFYVLEHYENNGKHGYELADIKTQQLGIKISREYPEYLSQLLPKILTTNAVNGRNFIFGVGCCEGANSPEELWNEVINIVHGINKALVNYSFLLGFINKLSNFNAGLSNKVLDQTLDDPKSQNWFPLLQMRANLDSSAIDRLKRALNNRCCGNTLF